METPAIGQPVTATCEVTITNELLTCALGRGVRETCKSIPLEISLLKVGARYSGTSILEILSADLDQGATATLEAHGPDAERAVAALVKLVSEFRE